MLELELFDGSGRLQVDPNTRVEFEQNFNLHDFEHVEGTKSWRFKLPKTPNNLRKTGWANISELRSSFENSIKIRVNLAGTLWKVGLLYFIDDAHGYWNVHFAGEAGLLKKLIGDKKLTDFDYPIVSSISNIHTHALDTTTGGPSLHDYVFAPVILTQWSRDNPGNTIGVINELDRDVNQNLNGFATALNGNENPMVPFPYVVAVLKHIGNELGVTVGGEIIKDEEIQRLVFFNVSPLNDLDDDGLPTSTIANSIDLKNHLPDIKLSEFLIEFCKLFNQSIEYNDLDATLNFIHRERYLKSEINSTFRYKVSSIKNIYEERRNYNLGYEYNEEDLELDPKNANGDNLQGVDGPDGSVDVISKISTLPNFLVGAPTSSLSLGAEAPLQLLFYRNYIENPLGNFGDDIPAVTSGLNYTPGAGFTIDKYSLYWRSTGNLHATWWEKYLEALKLARVLEAKIIVDAKELLQLSNVQLHAILDYVCFFEELKLDFNAEQVRVEAHLLKL